MAVCEADETYGNYAVVLAKQAYVAGSGSSLGDEARIKVLLADGTIGTYDVYSIDGKKPGETGYTAKETAVAQYDVYSYAMTDDGKIKLGTERGSVTTTTSGMSYTKGGSTLALNSNNYAVTSNTVFLYYDGSDVVRFVGKTSPDIGTFSSSTNVAVAVSTNSPKEAAVVFVNATATAQYDGNYLYIYKDKVTKNSDGYEADVILADGTITTITIDSTSFEAFDTATMKIAVGMYAYSVTDDVYSLSQSSTGYTTYVAAGVITGSRNDYITVSDVSYTLTDSTVVAYGATNKTASVGEALNNGDSISFVTNEDGEVEFAVITRYAADTISGGTQADIEDALDAAADTVEVTGALPATITVPTGKTLLLTGTVTGTTTINGTGTVALDSTSAVAGALTVPGKVEVTGVVDVTGTLDLTSADVTVDTGAGVNVAAGATLKYNGITSTDVTDDAIALRANAAGGTDYIFANDVTLKANLTVAANDTLTVGGTLDIGDNTLEVRNEATINGTLKVGASGTLTISGTVNFAKDSVVDTAKDLSSSGITNINAATTGAWTCTKAGTQSTAEFSAPV